MGGLIATYNTGEMKKLMGRDSKDIDQNTTMTVEGEEPEPTEAVSDSKYKKKNKVQLMPFIEGGIPKD